MFSVKKIGAENPKQLMIVFHGYGDTPETISPFVLKMFSHLPETKFVLLRAPVMMHGQGFSWFHLDRPTMRMRQEIIQLAHKLEQFIEVICAQEKLTVQDVSLLGFSQGAAVSLAVALQASVTFKACFVLAGDIFPDLIRPVQTPFFLLHGEEDQIVPFQRLVRLQTALLESGNAVTAASLEGVGHEHRSPSAQQVTLWLEAQEEAEGVTS